MLSLDELPQLVFRVVFFPPIGHCRCFGGNPISNKIPIQLPNCAQSKQLLNAISSANGSTSCALKLSDTDLELKYELMLLRGFLQSGRARFILQRYVYIIHCG